VRLGWISAYMSEHARQTGHSADAPVFAERAKTIAEELDDFPLRIAATYYLGTAYLTFSSQTYSDCSKVTASASDAGLPGFLR